MTIDSICKQDRLLFNVGRWNLKKRPHINKEYCKLSRKKSKLALIIPLTIAIGVMLSPESLVTVGNGMGSVGVFFVAFIFLAMLGHFLNVHSYGELSGLHSRAEETSVLKEAFGFLPAVLLPLSSKAMFLICASTGILATAGYVFNEVFVYWFPNLGFSFCLLCFLLVINLLSRKVAAVAQIIFVSVALLGLAFLVFVGLVGLDNAPKIVKEGAIVYRAGTTGIVGNHTTDGGPGSGIRWKKQTGMSEFFI